MSAIGIDTALHGIGKIRERPAADAVNRVGRDIGRMKTAERCFQWGAATKFQPVIPFGPGGGMA